MTTFQKALKQTTRAMIKSAAKGVLTKSTRRIIRQAKKIAGETLIDNFHIQKPVIMDYSNGEKAGYVLFNYRYISQRLKKSLQDANIQFMEDVFKLSQEYVPIDKRYAEATRVEYFGRKRKSAFADLYQGTASSIQRYLKNAWTNREYSPTGYMGSLDSVKKYLGSYKTVQFSRKAGWYEKSEADFLNEMFNTSNRKKRYSSMFYNVDTGTIMQRKKYSYEVFDTGFKLSNDPYDLRKTKYTLTQPTGGFQELKKGGKLIQNKNTITISYSAVDKSRRGSTFNYAALQHDNLAFKHKYGKSLFLYRAFTQKRREWYKNIQEQLAKNMNKGV